MGEEVRGLNGGVLAILILAGIFGVIGYAIPGWYIYSTGGNSFTMHGLFSTYSCQDLKLAKTDWQKGTISMISIGLICLASAVCVTFVYICCNCKGPILLICVILLSFTTCVCLLIGVSIYGHYANKDFFGGAKNLSYAFAFTVISSALSLGAGVMAILQKCK